jgi:hypothetical protein
VSACVRENGKDGAILPFSRLDLWVYSTVYTHLSAFKFFSFVRAVTAGGHDLSTAAGHIVEHVPNEELRLAQVRISTGISVLEARMA